MNEERYYDGQKPAELLLETISVVVINSKYNILYMKNQKFTQSQLWNEMIFAKQSLDYWKEDYQCKHLNLSRFICKILAIQAITVVLHRKGCFYQDFSKKNSK